MCADKNYIFIEGLEVLASVGIYDHEKQGNQSLIISLEAECLNETTFFSDDINETINYEKIVATIDSTLEKQHYNLIETLAETIAANLLRMDQIHALSVEIKKPSVLGINTNGILGIRINRRKSE